MRRLLSILLIVASPAFAHETVLSIAATATIMVMPNELAATMRAESNQATAAEAQARVNAMSRDAIALAQTIPGVTVSTGVYQAWRIPPNPQERTEKWHAVQSFRLVSADPSTLLALVGQLQQNGLALGDMQWRLPHATDQTVRREAAKRALSGLRGRAEEVAEILGLRFSHFRSVRLDGADAAPATRAITNSARSADATGPISHPTDIPVIAQAQAEAVLLPR